MKRRILLKFTLLILLIFLFIPLQDISAKEDSFICGTYFTGVGCSHCAKTDPIILEDLLKKYPNLIIIEYEIYQQRTNAPLLNGYNEIYNSGLGIPLIIFNKEKHEIGDTSILGNAEILIKRMKFNSCPLVNGTSVNFNDIDIISLPSSPKIWRQNRILVKTGDNGDNELLKSLLINNDFNKVLEGKNFEEIQPIKIPLSGKNIEFENAIKVGNWIFQWNGNKLKKLAPEKPAAEEPAQEEPLAEKPSPELQPKLTIAKIISLAVVDAINPCALAVLSLMLVAILTYNPRKKKNVLLSGLAFVLSVFIMYLIYGLIIIKSFQFIQALTSIKLWLYNLLGIGAIILGCFKLKDFIQNKATCKVDSRVNKIISKATSPGGAFLIGIFVTVFLLPCTIGPYVICGGILSPLCMLKILPLLLFYNLIFVLPMLVVVLIIYFGFSKIEDISSWQARNIKYLDLISGLIILALGISMLLGFV